MRVGAFRALTLLREFATPGARVDVNTRAARNELNLDRLLEPGSPYHRDFLPIYEAFRSDLERPAALETALPTGRSAE